MVRERGQKKLTCVCFKEYVHVKQMMCVRAGCTHFNFMKNYYKSELPKSR